MSKIILNTQKCYCIGVDITENWHDYPVCNNWQDNLRGMLSKEAQSKFDDHISTHKQKNQLLDSLKIIYLRLSGELNGELGPISEADRVAILTALQEDIINCSDGFHDRANYIVQTFTLPRSIHDLLYNIRKQLVQKAAQAKTDGAHSNNRFGVIANVSGYGIHPPRQQDPHPGKIPDTEIEEALITCFNENYNPLALIPSLIDNLKTQLLSLGYTGKQSPDAPYTFSIYSKFQEYLCLVLGLTSENLPISDLMFVDKKNQQLIDINWPYVQKIFFKKLLQEQYFIIQAEQADSLDNNYEMLALVYDIDRFNKLPLTEKCSLLRNSQCLLRIAKDFPQFLPHLLELIKISLQNELVDRNQLANIVMQESNYWNILLLTIHNNPIAITSLWAIILNLYEKSALGASHLAKLITRQNGQSKNCLTLTLAGSPNAFAVLINIIFQLYQNHILSLTQLMGILMSRSSDNWNCLAQAAFINSEAIKLLWEKFWQLYQEKLLSKEKIVECITQTYNGLNCFAIAIKHQSTAIQPLWDIISELHREKILQPNEIVSLFLHNNCLALALLNQPSSIAPLLSCMRQTLHSDNPLLTPSQLRQLFLHKTVDGHNCVSLAIQYSPNDIISLWQIIQELVHNNILSTSELADFIMQQAANGWNCFLLAMRFGRNAIEPLWQIIQELVHKNILSASELADLIMQKIDGWNCMMIVTRYHSNAIGPLWAILQQLHQAHTLSSTQLKELYLQVCQENMNSLMLASENNPESLGPLLTIMKTLLHNKIINPQDIQTLLTQKDSTGESAIVLAAYYHPNAVTVLLDGVEDLISNNLIEAHQLANIVTGINFFTNAAANTTNKIGTILEILQRLFHTKILEAKQIAEIMLQKNTDSWNCLMLAVKHYPNEIKFLITVIEVFYNQKILSKKQIAELVMQTTDTNNYNCLMLAAYEHHAALQPLLEGISHLFKEGLLSPQEIASIFMQKSKNNNWNCLLLAVEASLQSTQSNVNRVKPILESIQYLFQNRCISVDQVTDLIMHRAPDKNFLVLAAELHPRTISSICENLQSLHRIGALSTAKIFELIQQKIGGYKNSLMYAARSGPGAINQILKLLVYLYEHGLDLKRIYKALKTSGLSASPEFVKQLLDAYIEKTEIRVQQGNLYRTRIGFWNFGYSATQKLAAARELRQSQTIRDPATRQGELGNIRWMLRSS